LTKYTGAVKENSALAEQIVALQNQLAFVEISEGLVATEVEKLRALSENVSAATTDEYVSKMKTIRESFFKEAAVVVDADATESLTEEVTLTAVGSSTHEMKALAEALGRYS